MSFRVNSKMCATCIFGPNSIITLEQRKKYEDAWAKNNMAQQCHESTMQRGDTGCRGHYEAAQRGEYVHPAVNAAVDLFPGVTPAEACTFTERLDLITFEDV